MKNLKSLRTKHLCPNMISILFENVQLSYTNKIFTEKWVSAFLGEIFLDVDFLYGHCLLRTTYLQSYIIQKESSNGLKHPKVKIMQRIKWVSGGWIYSYTVEHKSYQLPV